MKVFRVTFRVAGDKTTILILTVSAISVNDAVSKAKLSAVKMTEQSIWVSDVEFIDNLTQ